MIKTEKGMPKDHISFSSMALYLNCPRRWYEKYYNGLDSMENQWMIFGHFTHEIARACNIYIKKLGKKDLMAEPDIKEIFERGWRQYKKRMTFEQHERAWDIILDHAVKTFERRSRIFLVEKEITMDLTYKDERITLLGRLDRVDIEGEALCINEYKSGNLLPSRAELDNDFQLQLYTLVLHDNYPEHSEIRNKYWALGLKKEVSVVKDLSTLDNIKEFTTELWQKMAADRKFEASTYKDCHSCPVKCKLYERMLRERLSGLKNRNDVNEIIRRYGEIKSNLASMKKEYESMDDLVRAKIEEFGGKIENDEVLLMLEECHRDGNPKPKPTGPSDWQEITIKRKYIPIAKAKSRGGK